MSSCGEEEVQFFSISRICSQDLVKPRHPIGKDEVDPGRFDQPATPAHEEKRAALPQKIGPDALFHRDRVAGSIRLAARRDRTAQIDEFVPARSPEPGSQ